MIDRFNTSLNEPNGQMHQNLINQTKQVRCDRTPWMLSGAEWTTEPRLFFSGGLSASMQTLVQFISGVKAKPQTVLWRQICDFRRNSRAKLLLNLAILNCQGSNLISSVRIYLCKSFGNRGNTYLCHDMSAVIFPYTSVLQELCCACGDMKQTRHKRQQCIFFSCLVWPHNLNHRCEQWTKLTI